jgi:hypothetical protein
MTYAVFSERIATSDLSEPRPSQYAIVFRVQHQARKTRVARCQYIENTDIHERVLLLSRRAPPVDHLKNQDIQAGGRLSKWPRARPHIKLANSRYQPQPSSLHLDSPVPTPFPERLAPPHQPRERYIRTPRGVLKCRRFRAPPVFRLKGARMTPRGVHTAKTPGFHCKLPAVSEFLIAPEHFSRPVTHYQGSRPATAGCQVWYRAGGLALFRSLDSRDLRENETWTRSGAGS